MGLKVVERGPRRIGAGIGWSFMVVLMVFGFILGLFVMPIGLIFFVIFGILGFMCGTKAWGAFTGTRRVEATPAVTPTVRAEPAP